MTGCDLTPGSQLAFIGLGALGLPMAVNLQAAGYTLRVHTRSRSAESDPGLVGSSPADNPAAAARDCAALLLSASVTMPPWSPCSGVNRAQDLH